MPNILEDNTLRVKECPLGIHERHTVLFDIHGVLRIIPFECTFSHNADMISNPPTSLQYENIAIYTYDHADASTSPSDTSCQFDEWCEKHGERDSHKAVQIAVTPHRLIAAEVPLELSLSKPNAYFAMSLSHIDQ